MKVVLYSQQCTACRLLEAKMIEKDIPFEIVNDREALIKLGFDNETVLMVGDNLMNFSQALEWIRKM